MTLGSYLHIPSLLIEDRQHCSVQSGIYVMCNLTSVLCKYLCHWCLHQMDSVPMAEDTERSYPGRRDSMQ